MWRAGLWYDDQKTTAIGYVRNGVIVFVAFAVTGAIFIALQRSMDAVNKRISGTYNRNGEEVGTAPTFASGGASSGNNTAPMAPLGVPINSYAPRYAASMALTPTGTTPIAAPVYNVPVAYSLFANDAERYRARVALADLRTAFGDFRDYDSKGLQKTISLSNPGGGTSQISINNGDGDSAEQPGDQDRAAEETARLEVAIDRVNQETEGLGSLLSLTAHPDLYPDALQDDVGVVSRELHTYLQDVRYAVAMPEERSRLLSLASAHLSNAEKVLQSMEQKVGSPSQRNVP